MSLRWVQKENAGIAYRSSIPKDWNEPSIRPPPIHKDGHKDGWSAEDGFRSDVVLWCWWVTGWLQGRVQVIHIEFDPRPGLGDQQTHHLDTRHVQFAIFRSVDHGLTREYHVLRFARSERHIVFRDVVVVVIVVFIDDDTGSCGFFPTL